MNFFKNILRQKNINNKTAINIKKINFNTDVGKIFTAISEYSEKSEVRFVGGCIRKILNNEEIDDIDLATNLKPNEIINALKLTGVEHLKNNNLSNLSGGEFQRVLIARAIAKNPDLLVLDEPVQGVDFKGEISLYELIKEISEKVNCGILLISHDLHVVMSSTDYVVCLNGHVCCSGTPQSVANNNKYQELFGDRASTILSVYEHKHDHTHSPDGTIKRKQ